MRFISQRRYDRDRKTYLLTFPTDLAEDRVVAWLRAISGSLQSGYGRVLGTPTIVFETWASDTGITHRIKVPWQQGDYIAGQLRSLVPGINVTEDDNRPQLNWTRAVELGMSAPSRSLRIHSHADVSASLLASVQALGEGETVVLQWVLTPAVPERPPAKDAHSKSTDTTVMNAWSGRRPALHDEVEDRRAKLSELNLQAIGRIGAVAKTDARAAHLVTRVEQALSSTRSHANGLRREHAVHRRLVARINEAAGPLLFPAQLNVRELAAVVAWPIGQPFVFGLPQGPSRVLPANENIPRAGRLIGHSNYPGRERPIALGYPQAVYHQYIGGSTGTGKTTMMENGAAQDMENGCGVFVIDISSSESNESLYSRVLSHVPPHRMNDVIVIDVKGHASNPVGFNILDQGNPRAAAERIVRIVRHQYPDTNSIWAKRLLSFGLATLAERPGTTFADLSALLDPATADERAWSDELQKNVKDPIIREFWRKWQAQSDVQRATHLQPLDNRIWELLISPEIRNIIGQSESSFKMADALRDNKIVLISLAGVSKETASLLGTIFVDTLWEKAQAMRPEKPNFLYMDEFQLLADVPTGLDDMLNRARKHNLGVVLATQFLEDVRDGLKHAVLNNARSQVIFQSGAKETMMWQKEMGRQYVSDSDFTRLPKHQAIARILTDAGVGAPVTLLAREPFPTTGIEREVIATSLQTFGRPVADVHAQMIERRKGTPTPRRRRPPVGERPWDE